MIAKRLESIRHIVPDMEQPLLKLPLLLEGKDLLFRKDGKLLDQRGQGRFDFTENNTPFSRHSGVLDSVQTPEYRLNGEADAETPYLRCLDTALAPSQEMLREKAGRFEEDGNLTAALESYRQLLALEPGDPALQFQVAEILYQQGDLSAAGERYMMAIELDGDFVEARANLACVLAESGQPEAAVLAFRKTLELYPDYADVHYHLGMTLLQIRRDAEANLHLQLFLELAPTSPWADRVRGVLGQE